MSSTTTHHCGKCGLCLSVCPVYRLLREEHLSPRAKIQLINAHERSALPTSKGLQQLVSTCLMCGACTANCPSGVDHYTRFMEMRSTMVQDHGEKLEIRGLIFLLAREERLRLAAAAARFGRNALPSSLLKQLRIGDMPASGFPLLNKKPFRKQVPETSLPSGEPQGTVLYFTGCATNYLFEEVGHATIRLLTTMGYKVVVPKEQTCCGLPMLFHGADDKADHNIHANIDCLSRKDITAIIVDCPTCGSALKDHYPKTAVHYGQDEQQANEMAAKVVDVMSFVYERIDKLNLSSIDKARRTPVTYHAPCHLKHSFAPAERVLQALDEIDYIPTPDALDCCGGGGTFFYEYPDISKRITAGKINSAKRCGADLWLTDCPVCNITLSGRLSPTDDLKVTHPACFLASLL